MKESDKGRRRNSEGRRQKAKDGRQSAFTAELTSLKDRDLLRSLTCIESSYNSEIIIDGQQYINFSSNDYLNLSQHKGIVTTAMAALKKYGFGSGASRLLGGSFDPHRKLEERIAKFKKTGAALVFNSGYAANSGVLPVITGKDAVLFSDERNHASIVDGARLSRADLHIYRHKDVTHLESLLKKSVKGKSGGRRVIVTDTVFSMDGDIAPLNDLYFLSGKYDTLLMIDDAHGMGVLGGSGRGALEHFGIRSYNIIQMGTLSKAAGCLGAFIAGDKDLIDVLINRSRSFIYSTSLPPAVAAAAGKAIDIIDTGSVRLRKKLWKNRERLYNGLQELGYDTLGSETPIIPVGAGDAKDALKVAGYLYKNNIFTPAIRPPSVPEGTCRIRFSVTAGHTNENIDRVLKCLMKYKSGSR